LAKGLIRRDFDDMATPPLAYAFRPHEKIRRGFVRVLGEISVWGRGLARRSHEPTGELIHEGRLLIKRVRALLGFARPALGLAAYTRARTRLRRASGLLADQRDLAVTQATLEQLARKAPPNRRDRVALTQIFRSLVGNSAAGGVPEKALRQTLQKAMGILRLCVKELKGSASDDAAWPSPSGRVAETFRAMLRARKKARRTGKDTDFHTWRKKAKRLLYQLELTQAAPGLRRARVMKRVGKLQDKLGAYHDCVVVEEQLRLKRQRVPLPSSARRVLRLLKKRKAALRKKTRKIARSVAAVYDRRG
jgi:CHAD domain-containing protein